MASKHPLRMCTSLEDESDSSSSACYDVPPSFLLKPKKRHPEIEGDRHDTILQGFKPRTNTPSAMQSLDIQESMMSNSEESEKSQDNFRQPPAPKPLTFSPLRGVEGDEGSDEVYQTPKPLIEKHSPRKSKSTAKLPSPKIRHRKRRKSMNHLPDSERKGLVEDHEEAPPPKKTRKRELKVSLSSFNFESEDNTSDVGIETSEREDLTCLEKLNAQRQRFSIKISTSSVAYQCWKVIIIVLSFVSSFQYAYYAAFLSEMQPSELVSVQVFDFIYFVVFSIDMLAHVLVDEQLSEAEKRKAHKLKVQKRIGAILNLWAIIPFRPLFGWVLPETSHEIQYLYLTKVVRLYHGFVFLDSKEFVKQIRQIKIMQALRRGTENFNFTNLFLLKQLLKTLQLIVTLWCISYFFGIAWYIYSDLHPSKDYFLTTFDLQTKPLAERSVALTYFAFTTLSTVGLGDYHPRSNHERVFVGLAMLFGVMITSVVMENFSQMLAQLKEFDVGFQDFENLYLFIGTVQRFNSDKPIENFDQPRIVLYFQHRWQHDKNHIRREQESRMFLSLVPDEVKTEVLETYLFKPCFLSKYTSTFEILFSIRLKRSTVKTSQAIESIYNQKVTYKDRQILQEELLNTKMMSAILASLEPIRYSWGEVILRQGDSVQMAVLPLNFDVKVGFTYKNVIDNLKESILRSKSPVKITEQVNEDEFVSQQMSGFFRQMTISKSGAKQQKSMNYPVCLRPGFAIGLYELVLGGSSQFLYRTLRYNEMPQASDSNGSVPEAYFIRHSKLMPILRSMSHDKRGRMPMDLFKDTVLLNYFEKVYAPVKAFQQKAENAFEKEEEMKKNRMKQNIIALMLGKGAKPIPVTQVEQSQVPVKPLSLTKASDRDALVDQIQQNQLESKFQIRQFMIQVAYKRKLKEEEKAKIEEDPLTPEGVYLNFKSTGGHIAKLIAHCERLSQLYLHERIKVLTLEKRLFKLSEQLERKQTELSKCNSLSLFQSDRGSAPSRCFTDRLRELQSMIGTKDKETQTAIEESALVKDKARPHVRIERSQQSLDSKNIHLNIVPESSENSRKEKEPSVPSALSIFESVSSLVLDNRQYALTRQNAQVKPEVTDSIATQMQASCSGIEIHSPELRKYSQPSSTHGILPFQIMPTFENAKLPKWKSPSHKKEKEKPRKKIDTPTFKKKEQATTHLDFTAAAGNEQEKSPSGIHMTRWSRHKASSPSIMMNRQRSESIYEELPIASVSSFCPQNKETEQTIIEEIAEADDTVVFAQNSGEVVQI